MTLKTEQEMRNLLRAKYKMLYVVCWEELRCQEMLWEIVKEHNIDMYVWSHASGMKQLGTDSNTAVEGDDGPIIHPDQAIGYIRQAQNSALFMLRDMHPFLKDAAVVRTMRDLAEENGVYKPVVMTSPTMQIPLELEKTVQVVDFDLPDVELIASVIEGMEESILEQVPDREPMSDLHKESLVKACRGLTMDEIENVLSKSFIQADSLSIDVVLEEKKQIIRKSGVLEYFDSLEEFSNVGGMDILKDWIRRRSWAFSDAAREYGLPEPKGILLLGVQGCGKSLISKSVAGLWKVPMIRLDVGKVMHGIVGSSEENMRKAIRTAEAIAPCVLFIDEIEKGLSGTGSSNYSDGGTTSRVFSTLLTWLQDKTDPVFVIATANSIRDLPPELLRKGRFDDIFFCDLPHKDELTEILEIHIRKRKRDPEQFDLEFLSGISDGYSGAEIEQAVLDAMYTSFGNKQDIDTATVASAIQESVPLSKTMREHIQRDREWAMTRARFASTYSRQAADEAMSKRKDEGDGPPIKFKIKDWGK